MQEVLPGVFHWTARHPKIGIEVSSYWLDEPGRAVRPARARRRRASSGSPSARRRPRAILLSNRHHYRESGRFVERFGCSVHCNSAGLHEFSHGEEVEGFEIGEVLPGGVVACELGRDLPGRHRAAPAASSARS